MTDYNNIDDAIIKSSHSVCYGKNCSKIAETSIGLPINPKIQCIIRVCRNCLPKFLKSNPRPADTRNKRTFDTWKPEENSEMSLEEYEQLKKDCPKELWKANTAIEGTEVLESPTKQYDRVLMKRPAKTK